MGKLESLIEDREQIREQEKELTQKIKRQRTLDAKAKTQDLASAKSIENYNTAIFEIRRLLVVLARAEGKTYKAVGEVLGISQSRAIQVINKEVNYLLRKYHDPKQPYEPHKPE